MEYIASDAATEHKNGGNHDSAANGGWAAFARRGAVAGLGLAGLVLGVAPYLAARRVIYPVSSEPIPTSSLPTLSIEATSEPEWVRFPARDG